MKEADRMLLELKVDNVIQNRTLEVESVLVLHHRDQDQETQVRQHEVTRQGRGTEARSNRTDTRTAKANTPSRSKRNDRVSAPKRKSSQAPKAKRTERTARTQNKSTRSKGNMRSPSTRQKAPARASKSNSRSSNTIRNSTRLQRV